MFDALDWLAFTLGVLIAASGLGMLVTRRMFLPLFRRGSRDASAHDPVRWGGFYVLFGASLAVEQLGSMARLPHSVERGLSVVGLLGIIAALIWLIRPRRHPDSL
jgi:hypothetical protein